MLDRVVIKHKTVISLLCLVISIFLSCTDRPESNSPLALLDQAIELNKLGKNEEAIELVEIIAKETERNFGPESQQYGMAIRWLAKGRADMFQTRTADSLYFLAEDILAQVPGSDSILAEIYYEHGTVTLPRREYDVIAELFEKSRGLFLLHLDSCHSKVLEVLDRQASLEWIRNRPATAIPYLERSLKCRISSHIGSDSIFFERAKNLMLMYRVTDRVYELERLGNELTSQPDSIKFKHHSIFAEVYCDMGMLCWEGGKNDLAQAYFTECILLSRRFGDYLSTTHVISLRFLAKIQNLQSKYDAAGESYEAVYQLAELAFGPKSNEFQIASSDLSEFYRARGNEARAHEIERRLTQ